MNTKLLLAGAGLVATLSWPVYAHHSFAAEFDAGKPVTLSGSVTKLEWRNPHIWVYLALNSCEENNKSLWEGRIKIPKR